MGVGKYGYSMDHDTLMKDHTYNVHLLTDKDTSSVFVVYLHLFMQEYLLLNKNARLISVFSFSY